jgi:serine/threonine-protein phosphatase 2A regulatory subunit B'
VRNDRERKKAKDREDAWVKLEAAAATNAEKLPTGAALKAKVVSASRSMLAMPSGASKALDSSGGAMSMDTDTPDAGDHMSEEDLSPGELTKFAPNTANQGHFRRKSNLPVDESVMNELSRHKSLEDVIKDAGAA